MAPRSARSQEQVETRLAEIVSGATAVFAERGYRRTQMADVAGAVGISPGNLYNYVDGKDALFRLVLEHALTDPEDRPSPSSPAGATLDRTADWLRARFDFREFPLLESASPDVAGVIGELYDVLVLTTDAIDVIEASVADVPELARVLDDTRAEVVRRLVAWLEAGARAGTLREPTDTAATARFVLESVNWFARKRRRDPVAAALDDEVARGTVVQVLSNGLATNTTPRSRAR